MSCGNSKQQLDRAGVNALAICPAPYRNSDNIITVCGCPFSEHLNEAPAPPPAPPAQQIPTMATSVQKVYNTLASSTRIEVKKDASQFNIDLMEEYKALEKNIAAFFNCPGTNKTEHDIQLWWNGLNWNYFDGKMKSRRFTTVAFDTHARPLENHRKPDCSHIANGCSLSQYFVVSLNDLKCREGMFNADDKGKAIDLSRAFFNVQRPFRSAGLTSYLCDGDQIIFFLVRDEHTPVFETPPMPLVGVGGRWLLSMLTTDISLLGFSLPKITVGREAAVIEGFLGQGGFNNVFQGTVAGIAGPVVIRKIKNADIVSKSEIDSHRRIMDAFESMDMGRHLVQLIAVSDCGSALIERPVCKIIATPISSFFLSKRQLHEIVQIGSALKMVGAVHLDMRPSNLLLNGDTVVLSDLGSLVLPPLLAADNNPPLGLSGTTKYGSPGMLQHLCNGCPHTPCFADDFHSILRVLFVSAARGAYERLQAISATNAEEIAAFWQRAFAGPMWTKYLGYADTSAYDQLHALVDDVAVEI